MSSTAAMQRIREAEFRYCAGDAIYFANNYCCIEDKDAPDVIVPFRAWAAQNDMMRSIQEHRLVLVLKARQLGITWVALYMCLHDLLFHPGHTVVALSKTEEDAKELVRRMGVLLQFMPALLAGGGRTFRTTAMMVQIDAPGDPTSTFRAFPASASAGRSFTGNILLIDEWAFQDYAEEIWASAYPTINRPTGGKVIGVSTMRRGTLFERLWREDNNFHKIFLPVYADPRRTQSWYEQTARDLGPRVRQEYPRSAEEALANVGGCFFPEFSPDLHVCDPFEIPTDWAVYSSMDYGLDMFAHYKFAIDRDGMVYVFHEHYQPNLTISSAAAAIAESDQRDGHPWHVPQAHLAPPDLWSRSQETGKSRASIFAEFGIELTRSSNDRAAGWAAVRELLKPRRTAGGATRASLMIFRTCPHLIRTLAQLPVDPKRPDDCALEPHELTHAPDALRYFAVYWTNPPQPLRRQRVQYRPDILHDYLTGTEADRQAIINRYGEPAI